MFIFYNPNNLNFTDNIAKKDEQRLFFNLSYLQHRQQYFCKNMNIAIVF